MVAVRWCEAEVRAFEWTNTLSNGIFAITAYVGWRLAKERGLPFEFVAAELLLIVVFVGSVLFHGTAGASWRAELLDELPMMLLAHAYLWSVRDIHPWTRPPLWRRTLLVGAGVPIVGGFSYVRWQNYAVFINTLTFQYFLAGGIAFSASRKIGAPLRTWYWFIGTFAFGKIIWEIEQYRYREKTCPTSALNPVYWFHAGWHVFAAPCGVLFRERRGDDVWDPRAHRSSAIDATHRSRRQPRTTARCASTASSGSRRGGRKYSKLYVVSNGRGYTSTPTRSCPAACWSRRRGRRRSAAAPP